VAGGVVAGGVGATVGAGLLTGGSAGVAGGVVAGGAGVGVGSSCLGHPSVFGNAVQRGLKSFSKKSLTLPRRSSVSIWSMSKYIFEVCVGETNARLRRHGRTISSTIPGLGNQELLAGLSSRVSQAGYVVTRK